MIQFDFCISYKLFELAEVYRGIFFKQERVFYLYKGIYFLVKVMLYYSKDINFFQEQASHYWEGVKSWNVGFSELYKERTFWWFAPSAVSYNRMFTVYR